MKELRWGVEPFNAAEWDGLNDAAGAHPGLHSINVQLLLKHFGTGKERVWVCRRGRNAVAMTILTGRLIAKNFHPDNQTVALWVQQDDVDFGDLLRTLSRRFLMLSVTHIDPDMMHRPKGIETVDYIETARTVISGAFEDYWKTRGSSLRDGVRKYRNRLQKAGVTPRMELITDPATIGEAVDRYGLLESATWKGASDTALHPDNVQGAYYRDLLTAYAAKGWASAWECWYGDKLVAANFYIHREGTYLSLKTAFDATHKDTSPSMQLRYVTFENFWPQASVIEYYGKRPGWNYWETELRRMYHVNAYRAPWVQALRAMARKRRQAKGRIEAPADPVIQR